MNTNPREMHSTLPQPPHSESGAEIQIGSATFVVTRTYTGACSITDLLQQRVQRAAQSPNPLTEESARQYNNDVSRFRKELSHDYRQ